MKTWEKVMKLDADYVEARKQLLLNKETWVEVKISTQPPKQRAALVTPKKDAIK